ncbi:NAD-dependent deacylase [Pseudomonas sp. 5Ae-yellow]|uniref:SIR2 family NAD-dependent protein deacylase n=1 Tax=Pseudomonas sp. 5Ae-yellow TaxID=2759848 RepID=UPI0015F5D806|nr:NAD-dependent deacylase [Pseudomonas sp. 5Ae-yellow]MBA6420733.1 NAD-dependent deacylase [Pseudomonas sp. 5Ae-yellow]|tara:strand:- start:2266 stop:3045 length:780 start_codon:yes stop_codon:yes gene_type:complete
MKFDQALPAQLRAAQRVVVFTGAGVSAESGIPTFRDALTGLWSRFDAARLATPDAFIDDPELVWGWYEWRRMQLLASQPNLAHWAIAQLAQHVPKLTLITQNVDDLHERAGSTKVLHLHGSLQQPRCFDCNEDYSLPDAAPQEPAEGRRLAPPRCSLCGGAVRPGVVWFGESLPVPVMEAAFAAAANCDLLLSVGTSGVVHPAAQIPEIALRSGAGVVHVNPEPKALGIGREWVLPGLAGQVLPELLREAFNTAKAGGK